MSQTDSPGARIAAGLAKIGLLLKSHARHQAGGHGLTPTQAQILTTLSAHDPRGLRLSEVAQSLAVTPATASDAVAALVAKGLVRKRCMPDDARAIAITLTASGRLAAAQASEWPDALLLAANDLSDIEQGALLRLLTKMIRQLQMQGKIPVSRMCATCTYFRPNVHAKPMPPHHCAYIDAPFGDSALRIECPDHAAASKDQSEKAWRKFISI
jgi:DNA-binding MarR family transcriptional regulator